MIKFNVLVALTILTSAIANPALSQTVIQESGAYPKNYPTADLDIGSSRSSRRAIGAANAATTVWPAPVGHRQPRRVDIPPSTSAANASLSFAREDAIVDRKINNICRGC